MANYYNRGTFRFIYSQLWLINYNIRKSVIKVQTDEIGRFFNPYPTEVQEPNLNNIIYINKLNEKKNSLGYENDYSKKDLLYYRIVDLDTRNKNHSTNTLFNDREKNYFIKQFQRNIGKDKYVYEIAASILENADSRTLKKMLKEKKSQVRGMVPPMNKYLIKRVIKAIKVYQHTEEDYLNYNENEFTFYFLKPLLCQVLKNTNVSLKLGESHLKCKTKHTNDELRAGVGPRIDIIISSKKLLMEISVIEVSGAMNKVDKTHFLGDRCKIARNLKILHKQIEKAVPTSDLSKLKKLKLFGVQVYLNKIFIYSLTKVTGTYYVFILEKSFTIPTNPALYQYQIPLFLSRIWSMDNMLREVIDGIQDFLKESTAEEIISSDSDISSVEISPRKKQKTKA